jgi:hypothetical protein
VEEPKSLQGCRAEAPITIGSQSPPIVAHPNYPDNLRPKNLSQSRSREPGHNRILGSFSSDDKHLTCGFILIYFIKKIIFKFFGIIINILLYLSFGFNRVIINPLFHLVIHTPSIDCKKNLKSS